MQYCTQTSLSVLRRISAGLATATPCYDMPEMLWLIRNWEKWSANLRRRGGIAGTLGGPDHYCVLVSATSSLKLIRILTTRKRHFCYHFSLKEGWTIVWRPSRSVGLCGKILLRANIYLLNSLYLSFIKVQIYDIWQNCSANMYVTLVMRVGVRKFCVVSKV